MQISDLTSSMHSSPSLRATAALWRLLAKRIVTLLLIVAMCGGASFAYSVLTHEEVVDLLWTDEIRPLLLKRYPGLTDDQIKEAHAYAYGGAVIQDLGYYPFGNKQFSNLVHYVRTGDFVHELLLESADVNEYAFALGALAHYTSDITGHPAVNQSVAIEFPKLQRKYGKFVTYAQDKTAHVKTEFGFDMAQVAKNRYASQQYHDFIGFQVSKPLLERVFPVVYGLEFKDVIAHEDLSIGTYRFSVSRLIPEMTQVALQTHKKQIPSRALERVSSQYSCAICRESVPSRGWASRIRLRRLRTCISRASLRPSINIGPSCTQSALTLSAFPTPISIVVNGPKRRNTR